EGQPQQLYVTFNNLPPRAKIRIFNLAGHLVRTLEKNDQSQFMRWDLTNEHNWQIGSGIYICHVEMPDIGETKIIKLAVVLSEAPPTY
ncbi:MAG TPA: T9SS type A sorting domain-containing protein, partial [Bacteroidota bacterium]|nr:T9SS type A sorting domain-containing protein [Bacteroidota bacterium]